MSDLLAIERARFAAKRYAEFKAAQAALRARGHEPLRLDPHGMLGFREAAPTDTRYASVVKLCVSCGRRFTQRKQQGRPKLRCAVCR